MCNTKAHILNANNVQKTNDMIEKLVNNGKIYKQGLKWFEKVTYP